jgi:hypothetical protein
LGDFGFPIEHLTDNEASGNRICRGKGVFWGGSDGGLGQDNLKQLARETGLTGSCSEKHIIPK